MCLGNLVRSRALRVLLTLGSVFFQAWASAAQDLPPALADRFAEGITALQAGQPQQAEAIFRGILQRGGDRAPVHHNLGIALQQRGQHEAALAQFRAAAALDAAYGPARLLAGASLIALGRTREARSEFEQATRLMPGEIVAYVQLADACQRLEDRICVADTYRALGRLGPDDPEYAYRLGSAYLKLSQWTHERLAKVAPGSARVHQALGREYLQQGQTEFALEAFKRAAEADPTLPDLHLALARIYFDAGRRDEAAREIGRELALVPFSRDALQLKARIDAPALSPAEGPALSAVERPALSPVEGPALSAVERPALSAVERPALSPVEGPALSSVEGPAVSSVEGPALSSVEGPVPSTVEAPRRMEIDAAIRARNWDRAERLLAEQIDRQPQSRELLALIARIFFLDGKPLNAAVALKKADAIAPLDRELRFTLVLAYIRLGRGDWARPELDQLVQSDPTSAEFRYWIGRLEYDAGRYSAAISRFNEALARDPQLMRAHDNLGLCYEALDRPDEAIAHYQEAIRLNRQARAKSPWPPTNLGILRRQRGELEEAGALFREALEYDKNFANAHYELGVLFDQQRRIDESIDELRRAAAIDSAYPEPYYVLARIYRRQGQAARADEALATFLRLRAARDQRDQKVR